MTWDEKFMELVHTITAADVGLVAINNRQTGLVIWTDFMGGIIKKDIGKRIYRVRTRLDLFQVENDKQLKARTA